MVKSFSLEIGLAMSSQRANNSQKLCQMSLDASHDSHGSSGYLLLAVPVDVPDDSVIHQTLLGSSLSTNTEDAMLMSTVEYAKLHTRKMQSVMTFSLPSCISGRNHVLGDIASNVASAQ